MGNPHATEYHDLTLTDVQRREIFTELISEDGQPVLSVEKRLPGGSSKRIMLLNKVDAQAAMRQLQRYLNHVYSLEMAGDYSSLSPEDMVELYGLEKDER